MNRNTYYLYLKLGRLSTHCLKHIRLIRKEFAWHLFKYRHFNSLYITHVYKLFLKQVQWLMLLKQTQLDKILDRYGTPKVQHIGLLLVDLKIARCLTLKRERIAYGI